MSEKISVTIITLNEEKNLPRAINSIKNLADEIVVVDSGSTDETVKVAKKFGAEVYFREFDNYSNQKNFAIEKTHGDWVFSLDADELVEPQLCEEIKKAVQYDTYAGYLIPRKNIILGKFIRHSRWQPQLDRHIWLWKKKVGKWQGNVHEEVRVSGPVGKLKHAKVHYQYETVQDFLEMLNNYSEIEARQRFKMGIRFSFLRLIADPIYNFLVRYFYRLGFLDGWRGFVLSYLMAFYHFELWVKIWELQK